MTKTKPHPWETSPWISKAAAAKYIHCTDAELNRLIDEGVIFASRSSRRRGVKGTYVAYLHVDDLDAYMRGRPYRPEGQKRQASVSVPTELRRRDVGLYELSGSPIGDSERLQEIGRKAAEAARRSREREERRRTTRSS